MKFFISSVIAGFEDFREAAVAAVASLGHELIRAEDFPASPDSPRQACLAGVHAAEAVILLMGGRYGEPQESGLSATHEEFRAAKGHRPIFAFTQSEITREPQQVQFVTEVQEWVDGVYTHRFRSPDELRSAITTAIHRWLLSQATGTVDAAATMKRAVEFLPLDVRGYSSGNTRVAIALAGAPLQQVLRPSVLEGTDLEQEINRMALFGSSPIFTRREGSEARLEGHSLVISQKTRSLHIDGQGSICSTRALPHDRGVLSSIIEEDVKEAIESSVKFFFEALQYFDSDAKLTHFAPAVRLLDFSHQSWSTRVERQRAQDGTGIRMSLSQPEDTTVTLTPPIKPRSALRIGTSEIAEDLTVLLRRKFRHA